MKTEDRIVSFSLSNQKQSAYREEWRGEKKEYFNRHLSLRIRFICQETSMNYGSICDVNPLSSLFDRKTLWSEDEQDDINQDLTQLLKLDRRKRRKSIAIIDIGLSQYVFMSNDEKIENFLLKKHILSFCSTILFANWNEE